MSAGWYEEREIEESSFAIICDSGFKTCLVLYSVTDQRNRHSLYKLRV